MCHVSGVKNYKKARSLNNEKSNRNNPGFVDRGNVYLYLKANKSGKGEILFLSFG